MNLNVPAKTSESVKKILPIILATSIFMQMLDSTILNTSLPAIAKDLNESPLNMQNAIISYVLTLAVFMPVSGFLSDKFGTKRVFIFSIVLFSAGSLFCSLSQNLMQLVIARVVQGIGGSLMTPVGKLALIKTFPKKELLKAMNFAIIPALFITAIPALQGLNIMQLHSPESAILSAVIFNALIIPFLIPLALKGVAYKPIGASALLRRNLLIFGVGGILVPFVGIKLIDLIVSLFI